jgi:hypothetical protein
MENQKNRWAEKEPKSLTEDFINHVYDKYYESYKKDSEYYERINDRLFTIITIIGFLVTIIIGLKEILQLKDNKIFTIVAFILPSISSIILLYITQKGFKRKEELREGARIQCKYLVNEAKIKFAASRESADFENIYRWLNEQIQHLQISQAQDYFLVHNNLNAENSNHPVDKKSTDNMGILQY